MDISFSNFGFNLKYSIYIYFIEYIDLNINLILRMKKEGML